jgi:heme oxygenase
MPFRVQPHSRNSLWSHDDSGGPMRARLRHATAGSHERLHRHPGFATLTAGALTISGYVELLGRLYGFHAPLERKLRATFANMNTNGEINPVVRETAHLLRADLLDLAVSEAGIEALPICQTLPSLATPEQRAGCLYVIEGAGLGGAAMARGLDYLLGPSGHTGRQFLRGRRDPDPMAWPDFCRWLEVMSANADTPEIIASARRTFDAMELWLRPRDTPGESNV